MNAFKVVCSELCTCCFVCVVVSGRSMSLCASLHIHRSFGLGVPGIRNSVC